MKLNTLRQRVRLQCARAVRDLRRRPYGKVMEAVGLDTRNPHHRRLFFTALQANAAEDHSHHRPLSAVAVVQARTGLPGAGFFRQAAELDRFDGRDERAFTENEWVKYVAYVLGQPPASGARRKAA